MQLSDVRKLNIQITNITLKTLNFILTDFITNIFFRKS